MSEPNGDPVDEATVQLEQVARVLLTVVDVGVRLHVARRARRRTAADLERSAEHGSELAAGFLPDHPSEAMPMPRSGEGEHTNEASAPPPQAGVETPPAGAVWRPTAPDGPTTRERASADTPAASSSSTATASTSSSFQLLAVHADAMDFFRQAVPDSWVPAYLASRSLQVCLDEPWSAGYAPAGWTNLTHHLRSRGWSDDVLIASGLSRRSRTGNLIDHFRDRLVLPLRAADGEVLAFVGRCAPGADSRTPKYLNSPRSRIFEKSATLFGLYEGQRGLATGAVPVLVEGPLDAVAVSAAGRGGFVGVATCGTALTDAHVTTLGRAVDLSARGVLVASDHDAAGDAAAAKAYERLVGRCTQQLRVELPPGQDPSDLLHRAGSHALQTALSSAALPLLDTAVDHRLQRWADQLEWVQGRVRAARDVAPLLALLPQADRPAAEARLAERLDLLPATVSEVVEHAARTSPTSPGRRRPGSDPQGREPPSRKAAALTPAGIHTTTAATSTSIRAATTATQVPSRRR